MLFIENETVILSTRLAERSGDQQGISIIESVDSISRDGPDMPYM